ncbi:MAG TPA: T9SS type A sorting domain-containing protein [Puia sp.]|jgi:hypothetical protein
MKKVLIATAAFVLMLFSTKNARAQFTIAGGAQFSMSGNLQLTLSNTDLVNNGTLSAGTGTISFTGNAPSGILGSQPTQFYELKISKDAGNSVTLQRPIGVGRQITFISGFLDLNGYDADLGNTGLLNGEQESSRVTGANGGELIFNGPLNAPAAVNPGNLGILISSSQNLGNTTIKRGHQSQTSSGGTGSSILRYYDIVPANNSGPNATLRFQYFEGELNGLDENALILWEKTAAQPWTALGFDSRNINPHYVEKTGVSSFDRFTLSAPGDPLPVIFNFFRARCNGNQVELTWQTAQEENSHYFTAERTADGNTWIPLGNIPAAGNSPNEHDYSFTDQAPIQKGQYRIAEYDMDGRVQYTKIAAPGCSILDTFRVWPNPVRGTLYINITADTVSAAIIKLFDSKGATIKRQTGILFPGNNLLTLDLRAVAQGVYFLSIIRNNGQVQVRELIKE